MKYKIVADSCCDITKEMEEKLNVTIVPLTIEIDGIRYVDNEELNINELISAMRKSPNIPLTSCPSPNDYMETFKGEEDNIFVITLSGELSGSYNSAVLARDMYLEENEHKNIHIFNSYSACAGEALMALRLKELIDEGKDFDTIVKEMSNNVDDMKTLFILDKLDNLKKAGRLSYVKELIANALNIKLILGSNQEGTIKYYKKARGSKALGKMVDLMGEVGTVASNKALAIAHCNAYEKAVQLKEKIQEIYSFKEIIIVPTRGISTIYANEGGIVIAY
jgi:DegV family protein with EDD domain